MPKMLSAQRVSTHINRKVTQSVFRGFDYSEARGTPFNFYVVINLHETPAVSASTIFKRIRHKWRDWLSHKTKGAPVRPVYAFALEDPDGNHPHVNWTVHIPDELQAAFLERLPKWIMKSQGLCGPSDFIAQPTRAEFRKKLAKYVLKGTDPAFVDHFHLQQEHKPQGRVWGQRAGVSRAIGPAARHKANFRPTRRLYQGANSID
jgi:hypothetical protein